MIHSAEALVSLPIFRQVPVERLQAAQALFHHLEIPSGHRIWSEGEAADRMAILVAGQLRVSRAGEQIGTVSAGEVTGEAGGFFQGFTRNADADAVGECTLLILDRQTMGRLRAQHQEVYDALLVATERALVGRVRATTLELAKRSPGVTDRPERLELSTLQRVWRKLTSDKASPAPPLVYPLLARRPGLAGVPLEQVRKLVPYFTPRKVHQGEVICMEGDQVTDGWLLGEGRVEVYRNVGGERAEHLTTLRPGDLFGHNGMLNRAARRSASCVAAEPGWIFTMDHALFGPPTSPELRLWTESMLISLMEQVSRANRSLELLVMDTLPELPVGALTPMVTEELEADALRGAHSALAGHTLDEELPKVEFGVGRG
ncbi:MAG: cyclic nucleotide-binding domain-containing protein [Myxococcota bacterium]|nr:cyclic nucleotide-binding domain-containing protein [Myxococcota bacterium]